MQSTDARREPSVTLVVRNLGDGTFVVTYRRRQLPVLAEDLRAVVEDVLALAPTTIVIEIAARSELAGEGLLTTLAWIDREMRDRNGQAWLSFPDAAAQVSSLVSIGDAATVERQRRRGARRRSKERS